ncbi:MAG: hypothetical protein ACLUKQ_05735 [Peptococcaceae bacterium]
MAMREVFAAMTDHELKRFCELLDTIEQKMKLGMSFSNEIYALSDEFHFGDADLLDTETMRTLSQQEANSRWQ